MCVTLLDNKLKEMDSKLNLSERNFPNLSSMKFQERRSNLGSQGKYSEKTKNKIENQSKLNILDEVDFPVLNQKLVECQQCYSSCEKVLDECGCTQRSETGNPIECSPCDAKEEQPVKRIPLENVNEERLQLFDSQQIESLEEIPFNDVRQSLATGNIGRRKKNVKTNSAYCINLWKDAKVIKKVKKKFLVKNGITFPIRSNYSGNPLDSDRPLRKCGKYYIRNNIVRKRKKKNTKMKKTVLEYRTKKKQQDYSTNGVSASASSFLSDIGDSTNSNVNTSFLSKEFLEELRKQLSVLNLNSLDKQKLMIKHFTTCKNQNQLWNLLRNTIGQKMTQKSSCPGYVNRTILDKYRNTIDNSDKTCDEITERIRNFQVTNKVETSIERLTEQEADENDVEENNGNFNEEIVHKTWSEKKMKRLEKKRLKKVAKNNVNLEGTIVKNKITSREDSAQKDAMLDLSQVVELVVEKEDCCQLGAAKRSIHSRTFRPYCNQWPMEILIQRSVQFVQKLVKFQDRLYKTDPIKGQSKRRYVVGFKEVKKYLPIKNRVQFLAVAPDLESVPVSGGIEDEVQNVLSMATIQNVPFVFSICRRKLGFISHKKVPVSCLAVLDYSGCEVLFQEIISLIPKAKQLYENKLKEAEMKINTGTELSLDSQ